MSEQPDGSSSAALGDRLRELRTSVWGLAATQRQVAEVLGVSVPLISSWEAGKAVPSAEKLRSLALFFCTGQRRSELPEIGELTTAEEKRRRDLVDELIRLRDDARKVGIGRAGARGALGGRFWYFPDGAPIRILTTPMWREIVGKVQLSRLLASYGLQLDASHKGVSVRDILASAGLDPESEVDRVPYASPWHPNYMESLRDADRDATIELVGHIRAENPTADVRFLTSDRVTNNDLTGHVVILGQADQIGASPGGTPSPLEWVFRRQELPLTTSLPPGADPEYDSVFTVTMDAHGAPTYFPAGATAPQLTSYGPVFLRADTDQGPARVVLDGYPQLEYDVALLARQPNELNHNCTLTICAGIFSRGTYGAVRALTDASLRSSNERFLEENFDLKKFWLLLHVPVFTGTEGGETVTPDLNRPLHVIRSSSDV